MQRGWLRYHEGRSRGVRLPLLMPPNRPARRMGMDLSIGIPAYNEAHQIARDLSAAGQFLSNTKPSGESISADDGSPDGTAESARTIWAPAGVEVKVLALKHRGKGWAVREGMKATRGELAMFADSGVCIPYETALPMIEGIRSGKCEIAHG